MQTLKEDGLQLVLDLSVLKYDNNKCKDTKTH